MAIAVDSLTKLQVIRDEKMGEILDVMERDSLDISTEIGTQQPLNETESKGKGAFLTYLVGSGSSKKVQRLVENTRETMKVHQPSTYIYHSLEKVWTRIIIRRQPKKSGTIRVVIDACSLSCNDGRI